MEKGRSRQGKSTDQMAHGAGEAGEARYSLNNGRGSTQTLRKEGQRMGGRRLARGKGEAAIGVRKG